MRRREEGVGPARMLHHIYNVLLYYMLHHIYNVSLYYMLHSPVE